MEKLQFPSVLAYERSIQPSLGLFYGTNQAGDEIPVKVNLIKIRGTISNYNAKSDNKNMGRSNLQAIEVAYLPENTDTLLVRFNIAFLNASTSPTICNERVFDQKLKELAVLYKQIDGYKLLASLYFNNLKNGRWLWRNSHLGQPQVIFPKELNENQIIDSIAAAFDGSGKPFILDVEGRIKLAPNQEVFPSQEFEEEQQNRKYQIKRILAKLDNQQAYFHSQKIGNAIRTIDTWYNDESKNRPIAIEPYGVDQGLQKAFRTDGNDLYSYLKNINSLIKICKTGSLPEDSHIHYVMACLIRGGVYSLKIKD